MPVPNQDQLVAGLIQVRDGLGFTPTGDIAAARKRVLGDTNPRSENRRRYAELAEALIRDTPADFSRNIDPHFGWQIDQIAIAVANRDDTGLRERLEDAIDYALNTCAQDVVEILEGILKAIQTPEI